MNEMVQLDRISRQRSSNLHHINQTCLLPGFLPLTTNGRSNSIISIATGAQRVRIIYPIPQVLNVYPPFFPTRKSATFHLSSTSDILPLTIISTKRIIHIAQSLSSDPHPHIVTSHPTTQSKSH